jgi:hypothetical protein
MKEESQYFSVVAMQMWSVTTKSDGVRKKSIAEKWR